MTDLLTHTLYPSLRLTPAAEAAAVATAATTTTTQAAGAHLDSAGGGGGGGGMLADAAADAHDDQLIRKMAIGVIMQWVATDDLDANETSADRLQNLFCGIADEDLNGELTDEEQDVVNIALNAGADCLLVLGVPEEDVDALLNDWEPDVADRVRELVAANLPDGDEAEGKLLDALVFTPEDQAPVFDSANYDAAYKKVVAFRNGKKVRINKRISGTVVLSSRQKVALKKARRKATSASAMTRRRRTMRLRASMGMGGR